MKNDFNVSIKKIYQSHKFLRPFFDDCLQINTTQDKLYQRICALVDKTSCSYANIKRENLRIKAGELTECLSDIINYVGLDVNQPITDENADIMFSAMRYGTVEDVEMLLKNGYDGSNLVAEETMYKKFKNWDDIPDKNEKLEKLKQYGIGDYSRCEIEDGIKKAKEIYQSFVGAYDNVGKSSDNASERDKKNNEVKKHYSRWFDENFVALNSLLAEMEARYKNDCQNRQKRLENLKVCLPYKTPKKNADLMKAVLKPCLSLNEEQAAAKLFATLVELNASVDEIKDIFNGQFYADDNETILKPVFQKFLQEAGLKHPFAQEDRERE